MKHCPQCGCDTPELHEGYCEDCCRENQAALDQHNAAFDDRAAERAFQRDAGGAGKVPGLADWRLDAELELLGHGDLDLSLLARRAEDPNFGNATLGTDQMNLLFAGELAWLGEFMHWRQLVAGAEQLFDISLREMYVVGGDLDRDRCIFSLGGQQQLVALDGTQRLPGNQTLVIVGDDEDGDRRVIGGDDGMRIDLAEIAVLFFVQLDAHEFEALAGQAAHGGAGFADIAGKRQDIDATHGCHIGADILAHLVTEGLVGEQGAVMAVGGGLGWSLLPPLMPLVAADLGIAPTASGLVWGSASLGIALGAEVLAIDGIAVASASNTLTNVINGLAVNLPAINELRRYALQQGLTPRDVTQGGNVGQATAALTEARSLWGRARRGEIIEDLIPLRDTHVALRLRRKVKSVCLVPEGEALDFSQQDGVVSFTVPEFTSHQMVELAY